MTREIEPTRWRGKGGTVERDLLDHTAAALPRPHRFEDFLPGAERADPGGPKHLVARQDKEIGVHRLHAQPEVRNRLRAIDQHMSSWAVRHRDYLLDRHPGSERIGNLGDCNQLGARPEQSRKLVQPQLPLIGHRNDAQLDPEVIAQELPGHDIGVVFELRDDDLVPGLEVVGAPGKRDQGDGLCGPAYEHDLIGTFGADETRDRCAGVLVAVGGQRVERFFFRS
jgi:hypothetical protein